ncbi:MAG TPA: site-specific integrase [Devosia sp.]|uniref:tyrosine-type recombinase/integrase n=1 Tax=Devosia sp. TaxID=1871048 RepID=UPI002DDD4F39|nr:site-specific integrase [Devosia sp.]HEV2517045.1 site-specific integrase [Devosia sp.]
MAKHHPSNERIKREYFHYLKEARRRGNASVDAAAKALHRFEETTRWRDFKRFHREQAVAFKTTLSEQTNARSAERLSWSTVQATVRELRAFFLWLAGQPGYKTRIRYGDADYFNLSEKELSVARAKREKRVPTLEQMHHILSVMPSGTDQERRSRALIAFAVLTGARADALASFKLKHIDLDRGAIFQDPHEVRTKFAKSFTTCFFPVGGNALAILTEWVNWLRTERHWGNDDPLFPSTQSGLGPEGGFIAAGLSRNGWSTTQPIRDAFRDGCAAAGLPYFNPHSVRDMLALLGERLCRSPEEFKAWSQNLGHSDVMTTLNSYGTVPPHRQADLIRRMSLSGTFADPLYNADAAQLIAALAQKVSDGSMARQ